MMWVYAVVPAGAGATNLGTGAADEPLELIDLPTAVLRAVVGAVEAPLEPSEAALRAHDAAVRRAAAALEAAVPVRFGQTAVDGATLDRAIAPRAATFAGALDQVRGCEQMTLRLFGQPDPLPPADPSLGPGARWLARRRAEQAAAPELEAFLPQLAGLTRGERLERAREARGAPGLVVSVYHLVPRELVGSYRATAEAGAASLAPRQLTVSGPWPAWAFAP